MATYFREDGILVFEFYDASWETMRTWEQTVLGLRMSENNPRKRLYNVRQLKNIPVRVLQTAIRLAKAPQAERVYIAVLVSTENVERLVNLVLSLRPRGNMRVMPSEEAAVQWLNTKVR